MTAKVSVISPAFDEEKLLATCVQRVRLACDWCSEMAKADEIIVCNNNSSDHTVAVAQQLNCKVVFESIQQISRARNTGASVAIGEWLLFID